MNREQRRRNQKKFKKTVFKDMGEARKFLKTHGCDGLLSPDQDLIPVEIAPEWWIQNQIIKNFGARIAKPKVVVEAEVLV